jgi:hypothetical protein
VRKTLGREKNDLPDKKCGWKGKHNTSLPPGWKVERDVSLPPGWKPDQDYTIAIGWKRSYCDDETVPKGWKQNEDNTAPTGWIELFQNLSTSSGQQRKTLRMSLSQVRTSSIWRLKLRSTDLMRAF